MTSIRAVLTMLFVLFLPSCVTPIDAAPDPIVMREHVVALVCKTAPFGIEVRLTGDELAAQLSNYFEQPTRGRAMAFLMWVAQNAPEALPAAKEIVSLVGANCPDPGARRPA